MRRRDCCRIGWRQPRQTASQSAGKADWTPLAGQRVAIWPDADAAGQKYAAAVMRTVVRMSATVAMITPPGVVKAGWEAADAFAEGWDADRARALVEAARIMKIGTSVDPRHLRGGDGERRSPGRTRGDGSGRGRRDYLVELTSAVEFWHSPDREPFATVLVERRRPRARPSGPAAVPTACLGSLLPTE